MLHGGELRRFCRLPNFVRIVALVWVEWVFRKGSQRWDTSCKTAAWKTGKERRWH